MVRRTIGNFVNFIRLLRGVRPNRSGVDAGFKQAREAMHVSGGRGGGMGYSSNTDKLIGKAMVDGHKKKAYGDPGSKNPVVGYGGQAPKHRKPRG